MRDKVVESVKRNVTRYIAMHGMPVNIRHGTNIEVANWISGIIDKQGKEDFDGKGQE